MSSKTILKTYFNTGDIPTEAQFADLIDSNLNLANDDISTLTSATDLASAQILIAQAGGLKKAASSLFATGVATPAAHASTGTVTLTFDQNKIYPDVTQTGNITLAVAGSGNVRGVTQELSIIGNSTSTLTLPVTFVNGNGNTFDNTKINDIYLEYKTPTRIIYNITKATAPDTTAPVLQSASTNSAGTVITLTYNESLSGTPAYSVSGGKTISSQIISGSTVVITVTVAYLSSDTITVSGGGVTDASGNAVATLSGQAVTNNVTSFANTRSLSIGAANQIPSTAASLPNLYFSNGTTDTDFTVAFWFKATSLPGVQQYLAYFGSVVDGRGGWDIRLLGSNNLIFVLSDKGGSANRTAQVNATTSAGSWMRVVMTYKGSTGARNIYINGAAVAKTDGNSGTYTSLYGSATTGLKLSIGGNIVPGSESPATASLIDQFLVLNKELSSTEVTEDYNSGTVKDPTTLTFTANRAFDGRFESNLNDNSSNVYNMTSSVAPTYSTDKP